MCPIKHVFHALKSIVHIVQCVLNLGKLLIDSAVFLRRVQQ